MNKNNSRRMPYHLIIERNAVALPRPSLQRHGGLKKVNSALPATAVRHSQASRDTRGAADQQQCARECPTAVNSKATWVAAVEAGEHTQHELMQAGASVSYEEEDGQVVTASCLDGKPRKGFERWDDATWRISRGTSRRDVLHGAALLLAGSVVPAAQALTLEEVTPSVAPVGTLGDREAAIIKIFETSAVAVVNVFDVTLMGRGPAAMAEADVPEGNGTGIVWDSDGHVVTNYHVLQSSLAKFGVSPNGALGSSAPNPAVGKRVALVTLQGPDGAQQTYDAVLVGADRARDLAVLQIPAAKDMLRPLQLGSSEPGRLRVGQLCLAIGNPFGFDRTLTTGVISGLNRDIRSQLGSTIPGGIQTDASINPGNSGGPLLDSSGRLIGVNTAIFTPTGVSAGVGFAIPVDTVARVVPQLISTGRVLRPSLGVQVSSDAIAQKLKVSSGALLSGLEPDGAAAAAGLLATRRGLGGVIAGDVIVGLNGRQVVNGGDLFNALEQYAIGDKVQLTLLRTTDQGSPQKMDLEVTLKAEK